jgi:sigma-B regulation protein RsbU (phosphoserine phosphatase)
VELVQAHHDLEEELSWAGELQRRLLAIELPATGPVSFSVGYEPLPGLHCGGDYYDVFGLGGERYLVVLGDVSGHGLRAAFITVMLKSIIYRGYVKHHVDRLDLRHFVAWLNDRLCSELERLPGIFVAFLAFTIDLTKRSAAFCNAGQHPPCILRGQRIIPVLRCGASLGFSRDVLWEVDEVPLERGDRIVAYTDGVIEIDGVTDGTAFEDALRACSAATPYAVAVLDAVKEHARRAAFTDDATVVSACIG